MSESIRSLLDPATLRRLILELERSDVEELEIADGSSRLFLRREPGRSAVLPRGDSRSGVDASDGTPIEAPLTGVYYSRPSPDQPAFVQPGDLIVAGQVVALIETMKLFNEVTAEIGGEVTRLVHRDGDLVEAGQALIYVRARAEGEA